MAGVVPVIIITNFSTFPPRHCVSVVQFSVSPMCNSCLWVSPKANLAGVVFLIYFASNWLLNPGRGLSPDGGCSSTLCEFLLISFLTPMCPCLCVYVRIVKNLEDGIHTMLWRAWSLRYTFTLGCPLCFIRGFLGPPARLPSHYLSFSMVTYLSWSICPHSWHSLSRRLCGNILI